MTERRRPAALARLRRAGAPVRGPWLAIGGLLVAALAGCGGGKRTTPASDTLTTRERQEAVARSGLPGATGISRALEIADTAAGRQAQLDSLIRTR